jgi:biopolymer transport protein ExbD
MEESNDNFGKIKDRPRSKKLNPKIDLSAMVSISFLLIVFFMVTIELSKPKAMELGLPEGCDDCGCGITCGANFHRITTVLLDDNNKIICYSGLINYPEEPPKTLKYGKDGIRKVLMDRNKKVKEYLSVYGRHDAGAIVIIKPSKNSNFGNLVDILDEMAISNIQTYAVVNDFSPEEANLLASN